MIRAAQVLTEISDCLCTAIKDATGQELCWCGIYPGGQPAWDYCGSCEGDRCGMGYVTLQNMQPYTSFGQPLLALATCDVMFQAQIALGVLRCVPVSEEGPSEDDMYFIAQQLITDAEAMRYAALCCFKGDTILQGYEPLPPTGGCVGGQMVIMADLG